MSHSKPTFGGAALFVPGNRPERFSKALATGAGHVIIDLEDAVPASEKIAARATVQEWLTDGAPTIVRLNALGTPWHEDDMHAVSEKASAVVLPKAENPQDVRRFVEEHSQSVVLALVETPRGIQQAWEIANTGIAAMMFGNVDFAAATGVDPACHAALATARTTLVYASAAAGIAAPLDGVTTQIADADALTRDLAHARELGFGGKLCIHPLQVKPTQSAFRPTKPEVEWATSIVEIDTGVSTVNGQMVDAPVIARARRILAQAGVETPPGGSVLLE